MDPEFRAEERSLHNGGKSRLDRATLEQWRREITWKRPRDFLGDEFTIFDEKIDPCDII